MKSIADSWRSFINRHTSVLVDSTAQKFRLYPRWSIWLILFLSYNVLAQGIFDVIIKVGGYTPWFEPLPMRIDFLFLTAVSVLMGYQALMGMRRRELDVTRNSVSLGIIVELGLVASDVLHVVEYGHMYPWLYSIRLPFIIFTSINFFILIYIARHLQLFKNEEGKFILV